MAGAVNNVREAAYLAVLTIVGGLLLACGFWVTGAGAMFDVPLVPRTVPASTDQPASPTSPASPASPTSSTVPAAEVTDVVDAPEAGDVEGGPDSPTGAGS